MSRILKFRVWDTAERKMHHEISLLFANDLNGVFEGLNECGCIVMQYTGFEDDNGAKIYDGDIVKCVDEEGKISKYSSREGIGPVKWSETHGRWVISNINNLLADIVWYGYIEIIGNVYENKELLEG